MGRKKNKNSSIDVLPITHYKSEILDKVRNHPIVIITGHTGCGKSTQVPQYLYEADYGSKGLIACLHPRCVAAISLANRVSAEMNQEATGDLVGFHVRFFNKRSPDTKILFMTTGLMVRTMQYEDVLSKYSVIIIDEAHERSIFADVMMAQVKLMLSNQDAGVARPKIVIMSATMSTDQIRKYYNYCPVINIDTSVNKKNQNVTEVIYRPLPRSASNDYITAIRNIVLEIVSDQSHHGHVLIFLPGEDKIWKCCQALRNVPRTRTLPFFASMDEDEKQRVFLDYGSRRKLIVATNVAETSLTIPGVDFVIDSGLVKRFMYDHDTNVERYETRWISVAEADQRKGRCGRTPFLGAATGKGKGKGGKCYRLYEAGCVLGNKTIVDNGCTTFSNYSNDSLSLGFTGNASTASRSHGNANEELSKPSIDMVFRSIVEYEIEKISKLSLQDHDDHIINGDAVVMDTDVPDNANIVPFDEFPQPEIDQTNLATLVLMLTGWWRRTSTALATGVEQSLEPMDFDRFPFLSRPDPEKWIRATQMLIDLSLMTTGNGSQSPGNPFRQCRLTSAGESVAVFPLDPQLGKVVYLASCLPCRDDVLATVAMLSVKAVLKRKEAYENFSCCLDITGNTNSKQGDLFRLRNIFFEAQSNRFSRQWCSENSINYSCLAYARRIFNQLRSLSNFSMRATLSNSDSNRLDKEGLAWMTWVRSLQYRQPRHGRGHRIGRYGNGGLESAFIMGQWKVRARERENLMKKCFLASFFPNMVRRHQREVKEEKQEDRNVDRKGNGKTGDKNTSKLNEKQETKMNEKEENETKYVKVDFNRVLSVARLSCFYQSDEEILMFHALQKRSEKVDTLTMNYCTSLNRDMLKALKPKQFLIKPSLWKKVLTHVLNDGGNSVQ